VFRNSGRELLAWMENDNDLDSLRPLPRFSEIMRAARAQLRDQASPIAR
jgi:adenylate cyclase